MFSFKSVYFVIFVLVLQYARAKISDKRLCIDENCSELIATGKTMLRYNSLEKDILSFERNEDVKIFSFGAGTRPELVGVEIKGVRGYVNKAHIMETKLIRRPTLTVDTELARDKPKVPLEDVANEIKANPTQEPYEIVDGTKIPLDVAAFTTETPLKGQDKLEDSKSSTKPLDSVPELQNVNQPVVSVDDKEVEDKPLAKEETNDKDDEDGNDNSDEGDDDEELNEDDGEDEEENDENDENENDGTVREDGNPSNVSLTNDVSGTANNIAISNSSSNDVNIDDGKENVTSNEAIQSNPNNEPKITETVKLTELVKELGKDAGAVSEEAAVHSNQISNNKETVQTTEPSNGVAGGSPDLTPEDAKVDDAQHNITPAEDVQSNQTSEPIKTISNNKETIQTTKSSNGVAGSPDLTPEDAKVDDAQQNVTPAEDVQSNQTSEPIKTISSEFSSVLTITELAKEAAENLAQSSNISDPIPVEPPQILASLPPPTEEVNTTSPTENAPGAKGQTDNVLVDLQTSAESIENDATTENPPSPPEVYPAQPTTETSIAMEVYPPIDIDVVTTTNPLDIKGEEQNPAEFTPPAHTSFEEIAEAKLDTIENEDLSHAEDSKESDDEEVSGSMFSGVLSFLGLGGDSKNDEVKEASEVLMSGDETLDISKANKEDDPKIDNPWSSVMSSEHVMESLGFCDSTVNDCPLAKQGFCDKENEDCPGGREENISHLTSKDLQELFIETFSSDMFLYLLTTSFSVIIMVFMWILLDKCRREGPLIARINKLEQQLLATKKENDTLHEKASLFVEEKTKLVVETVPNEVVDELNVKLAEMARDKTALEEQIQALEKELDTSTEVGIELNKIISEMLNSTDGSEILKENIEQMQKRVLEQQATINDLNETLSLKETEIHELRLELEICNKKIADLQGEVDKMVEKILRIEEERDQQHSTLESEIGVYQNKCKEALTQEHILKSEILALKQKNAEIQRVADTKVKEYNTLKETLNTLKTVKNDKDAIKSFLDVSEIKAQLEQMKSENLKYSEQLGQEREINLSYTAQIQNLSQEVTELREKYEKADKARVEINTKLDVLTNYFKEKEEQMQKEIANYETLWVAKEATSTTERIRYMQEELQNYKAQNESLKQEIINQEVELKSQISMLEKKVHENWMTNRQAERKLEEARQDAALLRNRLTLRERAILAEGNSHIRMQSPLHQNGELPISPPPIDPTQSPPPLFNPRDHITKSPPIPGMPPPPFLPPPLGATPFIPPPPLDGMMPPLGDISGMHPPPFIPGLPPGMFPGDHRPPPLGRMSSPPPVGGRYSPESTVYSEYDRYDRRSPSPPYDSEYGTSPPPIMGYSPYDNRDRDRDRLRDDRREYKRPQPRSNGRNSKGRHSSGSENDSLGKVNKKPQRKV